MISFRLAALFFLFLGLSTANAFAGLVTHYDATTLGLSNGQVVNTWTDISGQNNHANIAQGTATFLTNGIGGLPSIQFAKSTGFSSVFNMGTQFGIQGDSAWTMIATYRIPQLATTGNDSIVALGNGNAVNRSTIIELDPGIKRFDIATGFSNDLILTPNGSYSQFDGKSVVVSVTHTGNTGSSILNTINFWIDGWAPGQGVLSANGVGVTGNAATASLNMQDTPIFLGSSSVTNIFGFAGQFSELLVYNTELSTSERQSVETALFEKYDIQNANAVPEPSSLALLGIGAVGLLGYGWRRKRNQSSE